MIGLGELSRSIRVASLPERLDALGEAWVGAFPTVLAGLGLDADNVIDLGARWSTLQAGISPAHRYASISQTRSTPFREHFS